MNVLHDRIHNSFQAQGLMTTLGATLTWVSDGEVRIDLPFSPKITQQLGYGHAGAITSVVDSACGYAALTRAPEGAEVVTVEFKINLLRPAIGHRFLAVGKVQNAGRQIAVCTGEVIAFSDKGEKVVALMQATMMYVKP